MATKSDYVRLLAGRIGKSMPDTKEIVEISFDTLLEMLLEFKKVKIVGFGTFELAESSIKKGRDFQTGEEIIIPPQKYIKFTQSKNIKKIIK